MIACSRGSGGRRRVLNGRCRFILIIERLLSDGGSRRQAFKASKMVHEVGRELFLDSSRQQQSHTTDSQSRLGNLLNPFQSNEFLTCKSTLVSNSRGLNIFSRSWVPSCSQPKGLVFFCPGYCDHSSWLCALQCANLASQGYAVFSIDYEGHGLSDGLHGMINDFDVLTGDVVEYATAIRNSVDFGDFALPSFLWGQSMGGAVALRLALQHPNDWDGMVLMSPMCGISDDILPPGGKNGLILRFFIAGSTVFPTVAAAPVADIQALVHRSELIREWDEQDPLAYRLRPRLRSAVQLLHASMELQARLSEIRIPFMVMHGSSDSVTQPEMSEALFEKASTEQKTLRMYPSAWHNLLHGEPATTGDEVLRDIVAWLDERCGGGGLAAAGLTSSAAAIK